MQTTIFQYWLGKIYAFTLEMCSHRCTDRYQASHQGMVAHVLVYHHLVKFKLRQSKHHHEAQQCSVICLNCRNADSRTPQLVM